MRYNQTYGHDHEGYGSCPPCPPQPPLPQCRPEAINCDCGQCAKTIQEVLLALSRLVNTSQTIGIVVPIEVQTVSGGMYFFEFGLGIEAPVVVTRTTISQGNILVSICDISRIIIETSLVNNPDFEARLREVLKRITEVCFPQGCCKPSHGPNQCDCLSDCACAQGIQDAICANEELIVGIDFNGNVIVSTIAALTSITEVDVLETATLTGTTTTVLNDVELVETTVEVTESVVPRSVSLVSDIVIDEVDVLVDLTTTEEMVSGPVTTEQNTVVTDVATQTSPLVTGLTPTTTSVAASVQTTTENVVSDFINPQTTSGIVSGLTDIILAKPSNTTIRTVVAGNNSGFMTVTISENALGAGIPPADVTLNVQVGGTPASLLNATFIPALPSTDWVLTTTDGTAPTLADITTLGTPVLSSVVDTVQTTQEDVLTDVTPTTITGNLVDTVQTDELITLSEVPTTPAVLSSIQGIAAPVNSVENVVTVLPEDLFTITTGPVLESAALVETTVDVLENVVLETTSTDVISGASVETINVLQKGSEAINGTVAECGDGIVVVDNDNGDTTIYSTCEINAIEKL